MSQIHQQTVICSYWKKKKKIWFCRNFSTIAACRRTGCKTKWMANFQTQRGAKADPCCCNLQSAIFSFAVCNEPSVAIDSFQFAHYRTMIKIDFWQLYLFQLERSSFCSGAWNAKIPDMVIWAVSSVELRKGGKTWLPCFPRSLYALLPLFIGMLEFIGDKVWMANVCITEGAVFSPKQMF